MSVQIITYGGDRPGHLRCRAGTATRPTWSSASRPWPDYVKFDSPPVAPTTGVYFGETVGRYANRIAKGKFTLSQPGSGPSPTRLPVNNGPNALHGGIVGFGNHVWASQAVSSPGSVGVRLTLLSPNGDEGYPAGSPGCPNGCTGYPAAIKVVADLHPEQRQPAGPALHDHKRVQEPQHDRQPDQPQLLQPGRRDSFPGSAYHQLIMINANKYTPTDTTSIPLGFNASVFGTPFDFTRFFQMGARIQDVSAPDHSPGFNQLLEAQGYDHNWVLNPVTTVRSGSTSPPRPSTRPAAVSSPYGRTSPAFSSTPATS